jgi:hypothetical protein
MKKSFLIIFTLFISLASLAQNRFDIFYVAGNYNFMQTTDANPDENGELGIMAQLKIPIVFENNNVWYSQIDYQYFSIFNENNATTVNPIDKFNVHGFIIRTGYVHRFDEKKSLQVLFSPRFMTDFNAAFSNSVQMGGVLLFEKIKNENYTWKVGALYNQEFFGPYLVPVFDVNWKITSKLRLSGLLPIYGALYMEPSEKLQYGIHFIGITTTYRINEPDFENYYIDRRSIDVSAFTKLKLFDNVFFTGRAGYSLSRDYGLFAEGDKITLGLPLVNIGDDRTRANEEFDGSPFIHLRLTYSIPVN